MEDEEEAKTASAPSQKSRKKKKPSKRGSRHQPSPDPIVSEQEQTNEAHDAQDSEMLDAVALDEENAPAQGSGTASPTDKPQVSGKDLDPEDEDPGENMSRLFI